MNDREKKIILVNKLVIKRRSQTILQLPDLVKETAQRFSSLGNFTLLFQLYQSEPKKMPYDRPFLCIWCSQTAILGYIDSLFEWDQIT